MFGTDSLGGHTELRGSCPKPRPLPWELRVGTPPWVPSSQGDQTLCVWDKPGDSLPSTLDACLWVACQGSVAFLPF